MEKRLSLKDAYKIYNELKELIQDGDLHAHMPQVMKICDKSLRALKLEEYKAILIKAVIDCFGRSNYSDYLLAMFGLLQGYDDETMKLTERRRKYLLDKSCAYGDDKYDSENPPSKDDATNYKRTIKEEDIIERLATYLAEIEDWNKYTSGLRYAAVERQGKSEYAIADLPAPYYTIRQKFVPGEIVPSEQMLASLAASVLRTLFTNGESTEFEMQVFNTTSFEMALKNLYDKGTMSHREYHECCNFLEVVKEAAKNLHEDDEPIKMDKPYDIDWFLRFFDAVANISNEDMRKLWGKVLAGEMQKPGSFSLRTVETLRNMTSKEVKILSAFFARSATQVVFDGDGRIREVVDIVPFEILLPTIEVRKKNRKNRNELNDKFHRDGNGILEREIIDTYDLGSYGMDIRNMKSFLQDSNLISYYERKKTICLNVVNFGLVIDDIAFIIKQSAPSNFIFVLSYATFDYRQALKELYPVADVKGDVKKLISTAQNSKDLLEGFLIMYDDQNKRKAGKARATNKKYELDASIQRIKHLDLGSRKIQLEDENLLDTKYKDLILSDE